MSLGVVLRSTNADDVRIVVGVTIVEYLKQIHWFDRFESFPEIGFDRRSHRNNTAGHADGQLVGAARLIRRGLHRPIAHTRSRFKTLDVHLRIGRPGGHPVQKVVGVVA